MSVQCSNPTVPDFETFLRKQRFAISHIAFGNLQLRSNGVDPADKPANVCPAAGINLNAKELWLVPEGERKQAKKGSGGNTLAVHQVRIQNS